MKVAVSIPDPIFEAAEQLANLVVQANSFNQSKIPTVLVAAITSNLSLANAPGNIRVSKTDSGLAKPSVINVSQVITVDKSILTKRVKLLPGKVLAQVDEGLKLVLCL